MILLGTLFIALTVTLFHDNSSCDLSNNNNNGNFKHNL